MRFSIEAHNPSPAQTSAPKQYKTFKTLTYQAFAKNPRKTRLTPESLRATAPVAGSKSPSGLMAFFWTMKPTCRSGGNEYVNCIAHSAETKPTKPEKSGIAPPITKAMDQYIGTMPAQIHFPDLVYRGGALNSWTPMLL